MFLLTCNGSRCIINMFKPADPSIKYILNALSQSTRMEISDLPLKQEIVGEACLVQEYMWWHPERDTADDGGGQMQHIWISLTLYACFSSEAVLPEPHINQYTWLWLPWIQGPMFCLFLHQASETLPIWRCKFSEISSEILCCRGTAPSRSCEAPELSNRRGLFWPRPPS